MLEETVTGWIAGQISDERAKQELVASFYSAAANNLGLAIQLGSGLLADGRPRWVELCDGRMHLFELEERQAKALGLGGDTIRVRRRPWPAMHRGGGPDRPVTLTRIQLDELPSQPVRQLRGRLWYVGEMPAGAAFDPMTEWALTLFVDRHERGSTLSFCYLPGLWVGEGERRFAFSRLSAKALGQEGEAGIRMIFAELRRPPLTVEPSNAGTATWQGPMPAQPHAADPREWPSASNLCPLLIDATETSGQCG